MNKNQNVQFSHIGDFLDHLPEDEFKHIEALRYFVLECIPYAKEKLSYNVPFYSLTQQVCYIWPASIPWGNVPQKHVVLGFSRGNELADPFGLLQTGTRRFVRTLNFDVHKPINPEIVRFYLYEALEIDKKLQ